ncbi:GvpT/GvpP family gas vesicle accessory protein [Sporosarcina jiandibaonis]|uniref:GvpT/GvpP family gas vesicle accessory protein n=1 Tax=Sporosarcina jiandibaonis TaxID=2715535 RepID=UPI001FE7323B|nr:GvpT/GvpP family gas vesicle accessory protein [Sporosarcina jiandibaonis]
MNSQESNENYEVVEKEEQKQTENNQPAQEKKGPNYSMNYALIGGVVGAGIGLLANPDTSKKAMKKLSESELVKVASEEFRKTAQELLAGQAQNSIKHLASGYMNKIEQGLLSPKKGDDSVPKPENQQSYNEIKEENKQLNDRLEKIEEMLNDLVATK